MKASFERLDASAAEFCDPRKPWQILIRSGYNARIMKLIIGMFVFVLGMCSIAAGQDKKTIEQELMRLDKAWTAAELKGDKKAAGALIADDFVGTTHRGQIQNKAEYMAGITANSDMVKSDDYKITIHGDIAIMTHRSTVEGVRNIQFRSTHVWQKRDGKWLIIAHHGSQITPEIE